MKKLLLPVFFCIFLLLAPSLAVGTDSVTRYKFVPRWDDQQFSKESLGLVVDLETSVNISSVRFSFLRRTKEQTTTMDSMEMTWEDNGTYQSFLAGTVKGDFTLDKKGVVGGYDEGEEGWVLTGEMVFSKDDFTYRKPEKEDGQEYSYLAKATFKLNDSSEQEFFAQYGLPADPDDLMKRFDEDVFPAEVRDLSTLAAGVSGALGALALVMLLYGLQFKVAAGEEEKAREYKDHIMRWAIGLFIVATATLIMGALVNAM